MADATLSLSLSLASHAAMLLPAAATRATRRPSRSHKSRSSADAIAWGGLFMFVLERDGLHQGHAARM